ncbi:hypothetical protein NQZ68_033590 [Dissostichus eleginoides]|nr:hypothetical protein NQZ68_033590 [Dissostichus eleginoides]
MERIEQAMCATFGNLVACSFHQLRTSKFSSLGDLKSMYVLTSSRVHSSLEEESSTSDNPSDCLALSRAVLSPAESCIGSGTRGYPTRLCRRYLFH